MSDLNTVILTGRLTADPEVQFTQSGIAFCKFRMAVHKPEQEGQKPEADFVPCVAWRGTAEYIGNYLNRGAPILADGRISIREWVTQDGDKRRDMEVVVESVRSLETKADAENRRASS